MNCPYCGTNHPDGTEFRACPHCGAPHQPRWARHCTACGEALTPSGNVPEAVVDVKSCPGCGLAALPASAAFCPSCGNSFASTASAVSPRIVIKCKGSGALMNFLTDGGDDRKIELKYGENVFRISQYADLFGNHKTHFSDHQLIGTQYCIQSIEFVNCRNTAFSRISFSCPNVEEFDLSDINTSTWDSLDRMFQSCSALKRLDLTRFNTGRVRSCSEMFAGCTALKSIDLSGWNLTGVTRPDSYSGMFSSCKSLTEVVARRCNAFTVDLLETALEAARLSHVRVITG